MSLLPAAWSSRVIALAQQLGLGKTRSTTIAQRTRQLRLPFCALPREVDSLWWHHCLPLDQLFELPRGALSGPVQEDKAQARSVLLQLVSQTLESRPTLDIRQIDGLCALGGFEQYSSFEALSASPEGRALRLISYKDLVRTLSRALPNHLVGETLQLKSANWLGSRLYWAGEQEQLSLACAIAYARRRELDIQLPAQISHYQLSAQGVQTFIEHYHAPAMPVQSWSDAGFMSLLLDSGMPYARLPLALPSGNFEFLLLPKNNADAHVLGEGLVQAGAPDLGHYLLAALAQPQS